MESDKTKMCDLQNIVNNSVRTQASEEIKLEDLENEEEKFLVRLQHVGNAPILKNNKLMIKSNSNNKLIVIYDFVKKQLEGHMKESDTIIIYCNRNFSPNPSTFLKDLYLNFSLNNELTLNYAIQEAWG